MVKGRSLNCTFMPFVFPPAAAEGAGGVADGAGVADMSQFPFKTCYVFLFFAPLFLFVFLLIVFLSLPMQPK